MRKIALLERARTEARGATGRVEYAGSNLSGESMCRLNLINRCVGYACPKPCAKR
ncbi:hypothetical protein CAMGR0001_2401 [Campylobacter gracilis RM3268]|uniref:Uncharacterized protein n=1 Tax=Campylobacter gracilis RM3268 TaxID=553220 RepID=C8PE51_9BACT|nr:hypothetical protein CAMGR0001_2401 [Campylobacter gracilis RM3268]